MEKHKCEHGYTSINTQYADGGREYRCAAWVGAPKHLCGQTFYVCPHGMEVPDLSSRGIHCPECVLDGETG